MCVEHVHLCAYENLKLTRNRKRYGKKVVIRQKHTISSVGEMLPDLPIYISHEQLHMVYRSVFLLHVNVSGAFYCKIK